MTDQQDFTQPADTASALPLYSFKYLDDDTEYVGVMAQDVLKVRPDAVITGDDGFFRVNYARLGLRMVTKSEWERSPSSVYSAQDGSPEPSDDSDSDLRLKQDIRPLGHVSPEPTDDSNTDNVSDVRLKQDIQPLGYVSPEPTDDGNSGNASDIRLKRNISRLGHVAIAR